MVEKSMMLHACGWARIVPATRAKTKLRKPSEER